MYKAVADPGIDIRGVGAFVGGGECMQNLTYNSTVNTVHAPQGQILDPPLRKMYVCSNYCNPLKFKSYNKQCLCQSFCSFIVKYKTVSLFLLIL